MSLRSPLGQVLGHGAAREGVHHWWMQRLTSIALVPLSIWLIVSLMRLPDLGHAAVTQWIGHGLSALLLILLLVCAAWHSQLGLRVIIEDYVHAPLARTFMLILSNFVHVVLAGAGTLAVLQILFRTAA